MANSVTHAALPYPIKNARFSLEVPFLDADGDPTDPTTPDTEFSVDNGAFADCAEEVTTTSGSNGVGYITLSGAETNGSMVALAFKVASGPKATLATLYPRVLASVGTGTLSAGSAGGGTLGTLLAYDVTGCFIMTTGGTGGGGTGGANNQARKIVTYNTSSGAFTVTPNWETTPSTDTTYSVLLPEGVTLGMLKALNPTTAGRTLDVASTGEAGLDLANVAVPSGASAFPLGVLWYGTLSAIANGTVTLPGGHGLDVEGNYALVLVSGTNAAGKSRYLTYSGTGNVWNVDPAWNSDSETTPSGTIVGYVMPAPKIPTSTIPQVDVARWKGSTAPAMTGDAFARLGAPAGASVSADVAAIKTDTGNLVTRITSTLFSGITSLAQWLGAMAGKQTGNSTARTEIRATGAGSGTFDETTDSQEAIRDRGDSAWTTATSVTVSDKTGFRLSATGVDDIWDEPISGHLTAGSTGNALNAAGSAGDPWSTPLPGAYGAGTAGKIIGDNVNATVSSRASQASVDDVPTNAELATALASADDAVLSAIGALSIPTAAQNADALLARNQKGGSNGPSGQTVADAIAGGMMSFTISGNTLTVKNADGTTAYTRTLSRQALDAIVSAT